MKYRPEDFRGLTDEECAKMKALGMGRPRFDQHLKMMCYGHCCQAVLHLTLALIWLRVHHPRTALRVEKVSKALMDAFLPKEKRKALKG